MDHLELVHIVLDLVPVFEIRFGVSDVRFPLLDGMGNCSILLVAAWI